MRLHGRYNSSFELTRFFYGAEYHLQATERSKVEMLIESGALHRQAGFYQTSELLHLEAIRISEQCRCQLGLAEAYRGMRNLNVARCEAAFSSASWDPRSQRERVKAVDRGLKYEAISQWHLDQIDVHDRYRAESYAQLYLRKADTLRRKFMLTMRGGHCPPYARLHQDQRQLIDALSDIRQAYLHSLHSLGMPDIPLALSHVDYAHTLWRTTKDQSHLIITLLEAASEIFASAGDHGGVGRCLYFQGKVLENIGQKRAARAHLKQALARFQRLGLRASVAKVLIRLSRLQFPEDRAFTCALACLNALAHEYFLTLGPDGEPHNGVGDVLKEAGFDPHRIDNLSPREGCALVESCLASLESTLSSSNDYPGLYLPLRDAEGMRRLRIGRLKEYREVTSHKQGIDLAFRASSDARPVATLLSQHPILIQCIREYAANVMSFGDRSRKLTSSGRQFSALQTFLQLNI